MTAVQVSGDFFLDPASALDAIDAALEGLPADTGEAALAAAVTATLDRATQLFGITPEGVAVAVRRPLDAAGSDHAAGGAVSADALRATPPGTWSLPTRRPPPRTSRCTQRFPTTGMPRGRPPPHAHAGCP